MRDYNKSKVYKIESISGGDVGDCYFGSTTEEQLSQRFAHHRKNYRSWKNGKSKYCMSSYILFDKFGLDGCQIILLETLENCNSKDELHAREAFYIRNNKCVNKQIPLRTRKEYYEDNKPAVSENIKKYHLEHNEEIKVYQKDYREKNKEKSKEYNLKYRQDNVKEKKERDEKYRQEKREIKFTCECGSICSILNKSIHLKTKKHLAFICHG